MEDGRNPHGSWLRWNDMRAISSAMPCGFSATSNAPGLCKEKPSRVEDHLAQWLFTVCRNLAFDVRKKENRMSPLSDADVDALPSEQLGPRPVEALEHKEKLDQVLRVVDRLPKNQREVILLKFQFDLSYKEISEVTHLSVTNVGFLIHTAIQTLRKELLTGAAKGRIQ
ncbi:MAG: hypothetical protein DMG11_07285 [Acidobacteria bacterium]|nr:MAG: hypothetical protein DMG11_07285 [Acidobacteriota bacterium]